MAILLSQICTSSNEFLSKGLEISFMIKVLWGLWQIFPFTHCNEESEAYKGLLNC